MSPTTRSNSAQNSPLKLDSPSTTPSRKRHHCRSCHRPIKGHPKGSCPPAATETDANEDEVTEALQSMKLAPPTAALIHEREEENKAFIHDRRRQSAGPLVPSDTLLSLSTTSNELVSRLLQPGVFESNKPENAENASNILRWQEVLDAGSPKKFMTPDRRRRQITMPCTLIPPTPDNSFISNTHGFQKATESGAAKIPPASDSAPFVSSGRVARPLSRSMSAEERDLFMSTLANQAAATVYVIPKADAKLIQTQAAALAFYTHLVMNDNDHQALLILGRDESSVKVLARKIEEENKKATVSKERSQGSNLKAVAGAAVMGVVGTWAGLAFS